MIALLLGGIFTDALSGAIALLIGSSARIAVASFGVVAVATGSALGYFADRLPEFPQARRPQRLASAHHGD